MNPQEALDHIKQRIQVDIDCISETNEALHVIQKLVDTATSEKIVLTISFEKLKVDIHDMPIDQFISTATGAVYCVEDKEKIQKLEIFMF